jgi:hypothetical protein
MVSGRRGGIRACSWPRSTPDGLPVSNRRPIRQVAIQENAAGEHGERTLFWYVSPAIFSASLAGLEDSMDEETWTTGPSATRIIERGIADALTRNGVYAASALSDDVRSRATILWPPRCQPAIRATDDTNRTLTLDDDIDQKRNDPKYASSFIPSSAKPQIRVTDQQALFGADLGMVARGEIEIVDDRERPRR